jgi:hypothetical protein
MAHGRPGVEARVDRVHIGRSGLGHGDRVGGLALQSQAWYCGHTWEACPDETTPPVVNLQVDWVVAYLPE